MESGKGELGVFLMGNNDVTLALEDSRADFNNLQILPHLLKGVKVADIMAILGSIDVIMGPSTAELQRLASAVPQCRFGETDAAG